MYPSSQQQFPNSAEFLKLGNRLSATQGDNCRRSTEESFAFAEKSLEKVCGRYGIGFEISRLENHTHDGLHGGRAYCGYRSACVRVGVYASVQDNMQVNMQDKHLLVFARSCPKVKPAATVISVHGNGTRN